MRLHRRIAASDSQHPFGGQATSQLRLALGFAPQPCDWFAFSRMKTLQALFDAKYKSPSVGRAFVPGFETSVVRHQSPTYER